MALIDTFFHYLVESKGSDLHISEGQPPKVRIHGSIHPIPGYDVLDHDAMHHLLSEICEPEAFKKYRAAQHG